MMSVHEGHESRMRVNFFVCDRYVLYIKILNYWIKDNVDKRFIERSIYRRSQIDILNNGHT